MKHLFTTCVCLLLLAPSQFAKAQTCKAGTITALKDTVCQGIPDNLTVTGSSGNIQWQLTTNDSFVNITSSIDTLLKTNPLGKTTYFRVVVSNGSCADTSAVFRVFVPDPIESAFSVSQMGDSLAFNSDSSKGNIARYKWDFGDGDTSNIANTSHTYAKDTTYYVCLTTFDSFGCSYTFCRYLEQTDPNQCGIDFTYSFSGSNAYFTSYGSPNITVYGWDFGDGGVSSDPNPVHTYDSSANYYVCLFIETSNNCANRMCNTISVIVSGVRSVSANQQTLVVYPNPCTECKIKGIENPNELLVTDLLGRVVPVTFSKQSNGYGINFPSAANGMYLVKNIRTGEVAKMVRE